MDGSRDPEAEESNSSAFRSVRVAPLSGGSDRIRFERSSQLDPTSRELGPRTGRHDRTLKLGRQAAQGEVPGTQNLTTPFTTQNRRKAACDFIELRSPMPEFASTIRDF